MIIQAVKDLMVRKYDNYQVYIHNLANFDGIFLLKILTELGDIKPIIHHKDLISIGFKFNGYTITFRDSLQMLIVSLWKLGKSFNVLTQKSIFPHSFVNENNLDYIGPVPDFKYFDNILIFDLFKINIHKYPTLSSLAFAIYRTHFLKKDEIAQITGQIEKDIRQGYTGGAVDMYIPKALEGVKIFSYDVNSLYPTMMSE